MFIKFTILASLLVLFSLAGAFEVIPTIEDGIPQHLNVTMGPFIKIGPGYYYINRKTPRNWFEAFAACRQLGANLIAFETIEEWNFINRFLWKYKIMDWYWTAGTDLANQGKHVWLSSGQPILLNLWGPKQPSGGPERCDGIGYKAIESNYNSFNDFECDRHLLYICEAAQPKTASFVIW